MYVKCVAVPHERTAKKVEVVLSRISPAKKNVIKLNARVVAPAIDEYEEIFSENIEVSDNLEGIIPAEIYYADEVKSDTSETLSAEDVFNSFLAEEETEEQPTISEINADFEELENDLRTQLGDTDDYQEIHDDYDESIVQRHFVRDNDGTLFETDSEGADGHEVACYDNLGKLKRACGVIKKGQPIIPKEPDVDDVYSRAVADMFPNA